MSDTIGARIAEALGLESDSVASVEIEKMDHKNTIPTVTIGHIVHNDADKLVTVFEDYTLTPKTAAAGGVIPPGPPAFEHDVMTEAFIPLDREKHSRLRDTLEEHGRVLKRDRPVFILATDVQAGDVIAVPEQTYHVSPDFILVNRAHRLYNPPVPHIDIWTAETNTAYTIRPNTMVRLKQ